MLKQRLKRVFPDKLGSLVSSRERKDDDLGSSISDSTLDFGEELDTFLPNAFPFYRNIEDTEDDDDDDDALAESSLNIRIRPGRDVASVVSALDVIAADERRSELEFELSQREINLEKLQRLASAGLPADRGFRATAWKLLLGYLPSSRDLWEEELTENRLKYAKLKEELLLSPSEFARREGEPVNSKEQHAVGDSDGTLRRLEISQGDHPLSSGKSSVWQKYFEYTEISEQIDRDLQRTHPDLKFFCGDTPLSRKHREAMRNILLLFAKLNPAIQYVQGMNEILSPIYYVFSTDTNEPDAANAEADSFFCFVRLLSDSVDHFCEQLDNSAVGIHSSLSRLSEMLKEYDEELWRHLEFTNKVKPQFYAFRWITLLLTQEFEFNIIMRIWDSLMSNSFGVQDMLLRICYAMLLCIKDQLLSGDYMANVKLLQHYPDIDIEYILQVARDLKPDTSTYRLLVIS